MRELKIKNIPKDKWHLAIPRANHFEVYYPDRMGARDGVGYLMEAGIHFYVYRTKTQIVVRGPER